LGPIGCPKIIRNYYLFCIALNPKRAQVSSYCSSLIYNERKFNTVKAVISGTG
jgi:hypothetical protein